MTQRAAIHALLCADSQKIVFNMKEKEKTSILRYFFFFFLLYAAKPNSYLMNLGYTLSSSGEIYLKILCLGPTPDSDFIGLAKETRQVFVKSTLR